MEDVLKSIRGVEPEPVRKYYIRINGREYPIKQVVSTVLDIPKVGFTSMDAYRILTKLGFKAYQR